MLKEHGVRAWAKCSEGRANEHVFAIDEASGRMTYVGHQSTEGRTPRYFGLDPTGSFLFAANQDTDTIVTFRVDTQTLCLFLPFRLRPEKASFGR